MKNLFLKVGNTVAFAAMVIINLLANTIPIGTGNTGQISLKYENLFTPAPMTFAIWGVIYAMMLAFILYQWGIFKANDRTELVIEKIGPWFMVSSALNILWIFMWHNELMEFSVIAIVALLVSLAIIFMRLRKVSFNWLETVFIRSGFDVYFGWIIAAAIANFAVLMKYLGWQGFGMTSVFWTGFAIILAGLAGTLIILMTERHGTGLAIMWALFGICIKHLTVAGYNGRYPILVALTIIGMIAILFSILIRGFGFIRAGKTETGSRF